MGLSPKNSTRRNVHFKDQNQKQYASSASPVRSQQLQTRQLSNYPANPGQKPTCQCGNQSKQGYVQCPIHKQPQLPSNVGNKKQSRDRTQNPATAGNRTGVVGGGMQPLVGYHGKPGVPPAVLAYINNKQCPSFVPNARFAFEMLHSVRNNVDLSSCMLEGDLEDSDEDDEDDMAEEEHYDQLISCSDWGDISDISYRPLAPMNDDLTTETESVMSAALPSRRAGQRLNGHLLGAQMRAGGGRGGAAPPGYESSMLTSECDTNSMIDTTDDDATTNRFSSSTDRNFASRLMPMPRQRQRKKRKKPFPRRMGGRASSFSSITDSTMSLNIITVTLSMETTSFLGISIVGQTHKQGDGGIYVGTIMPGGAVAQDGRIEPGDMILQVNEYSFENMSNDDAVKILRDVVVRPGPIKLVVAKCWNPNPQSYLSLPKNDHVNMRSTAGDPQGWVEQTSRMMTYKNGSGSGPMSPSLASVTSDGSFSSSLPESAGAAANHAQHQHPHHAQGAASGGAPPQPPPYLSNPGSNPGTANSAGSSGTPGSGGPRGMNGTPIFGMSSGGEFDPNMMQHLSTKTDVLSVLRAIQMPNSGLEIKDRMWLKITIPNAFLGHSLVDWLFEHLDGFSVRRDAHKYASRLLKEGYIKHTTGKASFSEQCYYIFNSEHAITNMNNLSYPTGGDNSNAGANMKQRDPLEMDEENDVLAPLPYTTPWGPPQYIGYQPRTAGYQGVPGQPGMVAPGFTVNELDSFGPMSQAIPSSMAQQMSGNSGMTNGGHSSPGSSSDRSEKDTPNRNSPLAPEFL